MMERVDRDLSQRGEQGVRDGPVAEVRMRQLPVLFGGGINRPRFSLSSIRSGPGQGSEESSFPGRPSELIGSKEGGAVKGGTQVAARNGFINSIVPFFAVESSN